MSAVLKQPVTLALVQLASGTDKAANLAHARTQVLAAASKGAKIIVLPECFNSPYGTQHFPSYAETLLPSPPTPEQSPSFHALSAMAKEANAYLIGGSIPEADAGNTSATAGAPNKFYNTSLVFSPSGALLDTHRKVHLFDIDIPDDDYRFPRVRARGSGDLLRRAVPGAGDDRSAERSICAHLPGGVQSHDGGTALGVAWTGEGGG
ncbi:hypothetical protein V493_06102 [Pseudogymnoascus sp. VKM F-4281 (FW-2241)]|nr:hypothetical protein V493_06102 [Pseudogymnoascus sp. VKM F-4281 (FW-2241)]